MRWNRFLYWFLNCTWGIIMTLIGAITALALIVTKHKPKKFGYDVCFNVGKNWGGVSFGPFFITDSNDIYSTKCHEHGHGFQNAVLGPIAIFTCFLPSMFRYWLFEIEKVDKKYLFAYLFEVASMILLGVFLSISACFNIGFLWWFGILFWLYCLVLFCWAVFWEISKIETNAYHYDDIWFENQASSVGETFMMIYNKEK